MGIDVESAAVDVEKRLLLGDQLVAPGDLRLADRLGSGRVGNRQHRREDGKNNRDSGG